MMVVAGNIDPYTYLGPRPFRMTPGAGPTTALDLLTVDAMSAARLLRAVSRAFGPADHADAPGLTALHDVDSVQLTASRAVPVMVDGDYIGERTSLTLRYRPNAIQVLTRGH